MATTVSQIASRLSALVPNPLTGGVYTRDIKRTGDGRTPDAFAPTEPWQQRPAAVVVDGTDERDPLGPDTSNHSFPWVYFYAPPTESGKATIANAFTEAYALLHNWHFATDNGTGAEVKVISRLAVLDDPGDANRKMGGMRLQVTSLWRNA